MMLPSTQSNYVLQIRSEADICTPQVLGSSQQLPSNYTRVARTLPPTYEEPGQIPAWPVTEQRQSMPSGHRWLRPPQQLRPKLAHLADKRTVRRNGGTYQYIHDGPLVNGSVASWHGNGLEGLPCLPARHVTTYMPAAGSPNRYVAPQLFPSSPAPVEHVLYHQASEEGERASTEETTEALQSLSPVTSTVDEYGLLNAWQDMDEPKMCRDREVYTFQEMLQAEERKRISKDIEAASPDEPSYPHPIPHVSKPRLYSRPMAPLIRISAPACSSSSAAPQRHTIHPPLTGHTAIPSFPQVFSSQRGIRTSTVAVPSSGTMRVPKESWIRTTKASPKQVDDVFSFEQMTPLIVSRDGKASTHPSRVRGILDRKSKEQPMKKGSARVGDGSRKDAHGHQDRTTTLLLDEAGHIGPAEMEEDSTLEDMLWDTGRRLSTDQDGQEEIRSQIVPICLKDSSVDIDGLTNTVCERELEIASRVQLYLSDCAVCVMRRAEKKCEGDDEPSSSRLDLSEKLLARTEEELSEKSSEMMSTASLISTSRELEKASLESTTHAVASPSGQVNEE